MPGILERNIFETPLAVLDFETTGLSPGWDRAVELSIVRIEPGEQPRLVFDTLINPDRPMAATQIHGITDEDVADAPAFSVVAGDVVRALSGCVVIAYNVYFDMRFLRYELGESGFRYLPPHLCAMYLRPMVGLGRRCGLGRLACHGIALPHHHTAATDTLATAALVMACLERVRQLGLTTFDDLARRHWYRFVDSWQADPFEPAEAAHLPNYQRNKSRYARIMATAPA